MRVIAVSDVSGAVHNPGGLDIPMLSAHVVKAGSVAGFQGADAIAERDMWALPSELVVPAALAGSIDEDVAERIGTSVIAEAANGPTTPAADRVLDRRGITTVPDILANAGGVTASYFEWAQSRQGYAWEDDVVAERLRKVMLAAFDAVWAKAETLSVSLRRAAFALAVERVAEAIAARGLFP
jgi:glutamate dehydrogenase (NAD(P)+)